MGSTSFDLVQGFRDDENVIMDVQFRSSFAEQADNDSYSIILLVQLLVSIITTGQFQNYRVKYLLNASWIVAIWIIFMFFLAVFAFIISFRISKDVKKLFLQQQLKPHYESQTGMLFVKIVSLVILLALAVLYLIIASTGNIDT